MLAIDPDNQALYALRASMTYDEIADMQTFLPEEMVILHRLTMPNTAELFDSALIACLALCNGYFYGFEC